MLFVEVSCLLGCKGQLCSLHHLRCAWQLMVDLVCNSLKYWPGDDVSVVALEVVRLADHYNTAVSRVVGREVTRERALVVFPSSPVVKLAGSSLAGDSYFFVIDVGRSAAAYRAFKENLQFINGLCATDAALDYFGLERFYLTAVVHDFLDDLGFDHIAFIGYRIIDSEQLQRRKLYPITIGHPWKGKS